MVKSERRIRVSLFSIHYSLLPVLRTRRPRTPTAERNSVRTKAKDENWEDTYEGTLLVTWQRTGKVSWARAGVVARKEPCLVRGEETWTETQAVKQTEAWAVL